MCNFPLISYPSFFTRKSDQCHRLSRPAASVKQTKLNLTQRFIATGFDCNAGSNGRFVRRRIQLLAAVERRVGRSLFVVLQNVLTRIKYIRTQDVTKDDGAFRVEDVDPR